MKAYLLYKGKDFDLKRALPANEQALTQDLSLDTLFTAMADGDKFLFQVARSVVISSLTDDLETIFYRQDILKDCLNNASMVRAIYQLSINTMENERKNYRSLLSFYPTGILDRSVEVMRMFVTALTELRTIAREYAYAFHSDGFRRFFAMIEKELDDDYFAEIRGHLKELKFNSGVLISAELGKGCKGVNHVLRKLPSNNQNWFGRIFVDRPESYGFHIHPRDESGFRAVSQLNDIGINLVSNALAQSCDHILSFFTMLRTELSFYIGCLNLHDRLTKNGEPICFPVPVAANSRKHSFVGLYDVCLALTLEKKIVPNNLEGDDKSLFLITGANQGGKSTFLRGIGLAQLLMQCGMFVPATSFSANIGSGLFTHYKREEDARMKSGKLDEELNRMSAIINDLEPTSIALFNESFAATNEREGSEIATDIIRALLEEGIKIFFVTHSYEMAHGFFKRNIPAAVFLRAERRDDGERTFKLVEGEPLQTSFGEDLYRSIFVEDARRPGAGP